MIEKAVHQGPGWAGVAVELDAADIAFDGAQDEHCAAVDDLRLPAYDSQNVSVGTIARL